MLKMYGSRSLIAILSFLTIGAALSFGVAAAFAGDDSVTEDQIVRALQPAKKPLTRGLTVGPQADPAATAEEGRFVQTIRGRATRSPGTRSSRRYARPSGALPRREPRPARGFASRRTHDHQRWGTPPVLCMIRCSAGQAGAIRVEAIEAIREW